MAKKPKYETVILPSLDVILGLLRSGFTETSIAKRLGIGRSTWEACKANHPDFREHLFKGRMDVGALCVNNLLKRANGYDYDEITTEITDGGGPSSQGQPGSQRRIVKKVTKHVPPDVAANIFIICNRLKNWQHVQYIKHSGEIKGSGVLLTGPPLKKEEWLKFYKENVQDAQKKESEPPSGPL